MADGDAILIQFSSRNIVQHFMKKESLTSDLTLTKWKYFISSSYLNGFSYKLWMNSYKWNIFTIRTYKHTILREFDSFSIGYDTKWLEIQILMPHYVPFNTHIKHFTMITIFTTHRTYMIIHYNIPLTLLTMCWDI